MKKILLALLLFPMMASAQFITHGPVTGAVTYNSARVYIRTGVLSPFIMEVDDDSTFASPSTYAISVDPTKDSTAITNITGLVANTYYYVRFKFSGVPDVRKGRFKTFPTPGEETNFTLVAGSCQETPNMNTFDRMAELDPLLFLHMGDFTYPSYQLDNTYPTVYSTVQLSWRKRYEENRTKDMLWTVPIDYIHDDDDGFGTQQNYWTTPGFTANIDTTYIQNYFTIDTIPIIGRYNHTKAYTEYFPHYPLADTSQGLYHSFVVGNTEIFFLDTRSSADLNTAGFVYDSLNNHWSFAPDTSHSILGNAQMNWLKQGLQSSTADWKILVSGLPFNKSLRLLIDFGIIFQDAVFDIGGNVGTGMRLAAAFANYWAGFPDDQQELLDFIQINNIQDVFVVSGDTHHNVIDDGFNAGLPELNASGLSVTDLGLAYYINEYSEPLGFPVLDSMWNVGGNGLAPDTNLLNAFGKVEVFGDDSVRLCAVDENGQNIACHTIVHSSIIGLEEEKLSAISNIYPNPTKGSFTIDMNPEFNFTTKDQLYLVNTEGRWVKDLRATNVGNTPLVFDISEQPKGIYFVIFDGKYGRFFKKIILQ